jgi:hypothetical protein
LDRTERLSPGHGAVNLGLIAAEDKIGAVVGLDARLSKSLSAFAEANALWDIYGRSLDYQALGGLRFRW